MLKPKPAIYDRIFVIGAKSATTATVGGTWKQPKLGLSYLLAARHAIVCAQADERLSEIALPTAYLQRHALEVELKEWLATVQHIARYGEWLKLLGQDDQADPPPETATIPITHSHLVVRDALVVALSAAKLEPLPAEVLRLCDQLAKQEANAPERYRYREVKFSKKGPLEEAFPKRITLPVVETQETMEDVFQQFFDFDPDGPDEQRTWGGKLAYEAYAVGQTVLENYPSSWGT